MPRTLAVPPRSFDQLVRGVRAALLEGQAVADRAYLQTYHRTGQLIDAHLLANRTRADYGARVIPRLAEALSTNDRLLYRCLRFYRCFPILTGRSELVWAHYRVLIELADGAQRTALAKETIRRGWTSTQLEERVRALNAIATTPAEPSPASASPPRLLTPKRGRPGLCRVIADGVGVAVDLGFACYLTPNPATKLRTNDFVRVTAYGIQTVPDAKKADLFTYRAEVLRVVDGDTLWVKVFLRPDQWVKQKLRLRDLDCPELPTPEGKAAKRFVEALLADTPELTITTTKPDKYDRYLADVFVEGNGEDAVYLNNELLRHGHAVRKGDYSPADWED